MDDFARYLESKRSVDDRALNRRVWDRLAAELPFPAAGLVEVCDVGAGTGTGVERMLRWELLPRNAAKFTLVEPDPGLARRARERLGGLDVPFDVVERQLSELAERERYHLVVAHAVLDILELDSALERLVALARPGGLLYLPITFDGETVFEPAHPDDGAILDAYHASMEPTGDGRTGRRLYHALERLPVDLLELGSSDWIVHPRGGAYPDDEAFFLAFLVSTVEGAVEGRVSSARLSEWSRARRRQIEAAELVFIAHQLDALARRRD